MKFNYQARTQKGKSQVGAIEASSKEAALALLQKHNLFVTFLEETGARPFYARKIRLFGRVSSKEIVIFSRQLALMFKSQIPLLQALRTLAEQHKNPNFQEKILTLAEDVEGGTLLSRALARFPKLFSPFYVNMIKSGEASGTLSKSLTYLADHLERDYNLFSKIKGAMLYPALIVLMVAGVLAMMMFFVIPNLATVLQGTGQELPLITTVVINFSAFFKKWGWIFLFIFGGALFFIFRHLKTVQGKKLKDRIILRLPLIGPFSKKLYITRFAENLSTLITGGLPIAQALEITGDVVGNDVYKTLISQIRDEVKRGENISKILTRHPKQFPPLLNQMVIVGEKTGNLDKSLMNVVDFYQKDVERSMENLLNILEPLLIMFLGLVVAGLMGAVLMPLYKMTGF